MSGHDVQAEKVCREVKLLQEKPAPVSLSLRRLEFRAVLYFFYAVPLALSESESLTSSILRRITAPRRLVRVTVSPELQPGRFPNKFSQLFFSNFKLKDQRSPTRTKD
jgi:hypothetical protein